MISDWLDAVRAFGLLAIFVTIGAVVVGVLILFMSNKLFPLIAAVLAFVAGVWVNSVV